MHKDKKKSYIEEMKSFFKKTSTVYVTHYQGLSVKQIDELRSELRKHGILFKITKNRITKLALEGSKFKKLENLFSGPTKANFVIRFFVTLNSIPCFLISDFSSSICFTVSP